jgi:hypothetical protein
MQCTEKDCFYQKNKRRLGEIQHTLHHPIWSFTLMRRLRIKEVQGDFIIANENDGRTPVNTPLHLGEVNVY